MDREITFYSIPLKVNLTKIQEGLSDKPELHEAILMYKEELESQDVETWVVDKNMIITEDGYKIAFYSEKQEIDYQEKCETTIKHLITLINNHKLQRYFSPEVLQDALTIKNGYNARQGNSRA